MKIIAIEGGVCAGKTTLIQSSNLPSLPDYWKYKTQFLTELCFPAMNISQLLANNQFFLEIEKLRLQQLNEWSQNRLVLLDRSFLSLLGFDYAFMKMFAIEGFARIYEFWENNPKIQPDEVIFLDISHSEREKRFKGRGKTCDQTILLTEEFNNSFKEFFLAQQDKFKITYLSESISFQDIIT